MNALLLVGGNRLGKEQGRFGRWDSRKKDSRKIVINIAGFFSYGNKSLIIIYGNITDLTLTKILKRWGYKESSQLSQSVNSKKHEWSHKFVHDEYWVKSNHSPHVDDFNLQEHSSIGLHILNVVIISLCCNHCTYWFTYQHITPLEKSSLYL